VAGGPGTVVCGATDRPERELWEVDAPQGGFLRVSGNWDRGWSARVDGRWQPVLRADGVFRGVAVGPGRHVVEFTYENVDEARGRLVGVAALLVTALLTVATPAWRAAVARTRRGRPDSSRGDESAQDH
jgi:hypothetical protein